MIWLSVSVVLILAVLVPGWHRRLAIAVLSPIVAFLVRAYRGDTKQWKP